MGELRNSFTATREARQNHLTSRRTSDSPSRGGKMCVLCDAGMPQDHSRLPARSQLGRRDFLKTAAATGAAAAGLMLFSPRPAAAAVGDPPAGTGQPGRRYVIRGGSIMSMDPNVGDFTKGDVLVEGKKILAVGRSVGAGGADVIDASG